VIYAGEYAASDVYRNEVRGKIRQPLLPDHCRFVELGVRQ
jgi:hypothetical protein